MRRSLLIAHAAAAAIVLAGGARRAPPENIFDDNPFDGDRHSGDRDEITLNHRFREPERPSPSTSPDARNAGSGAGARRAAERLAREAEYRRQLYDRTGK